MSALVWGVTWGSLFWLDDRVALANLAMLLVLAAALASLWQPVLVSFVSSLAAVLAFNWFFVPPRGSFTVDGHQHVLLLMAMFGVSCITGTLMARLRGQAALANRQACEAEQLRSFSDRLRDGVEPQALAPLLQEELQTLLALPVRLMLLKGRLPPSDSADDVLLLGAVADADQTAGMWQCLRHGHAFGPGTGRYGELSAWYLPLRGRSASHGAALIQLPRAEGPTPCSARRPSLFAIKWVWRWSAWRSSKPSAERGPRRPTRPLGTRCWRPSRMTTARRWLAS
ncbi:DUF4118 domain-containing protein [Roseateles sp. GG27B]